MSGRKRLKTKKEAVAKVEPMDPELVIWLRAALVELWTNGHKPNGLRMAQTEAELPEACECTKQQVAAHKAWLRMYMENAIEAAGINYDWFDAIRVWGSIKLDGVVPEIEDICIDHVEKAAREVSCEMPSDFDRFKQACLGFERSLFKSDKVLGKTADLVAYDQKVKALWRETWKRFLQKYWPVNEEARIVCLPGRRPEREIGLYRQLGYPGFVDGIEGGSRQAQDEFLARMEFLGIQFHGGTDRIERRLIDSQIRYQVVSLDLIGPYSGITEQILTRLRLDTRAWIMINLQAAREKDSGSAALAAAYRSFAYQKRVQRLRDDFRNSSFWTEGSRKKLREFLSESTEVESAELSIHRGSALDSLLLNRLGMQLTEHSIHDALIRELAPFIENGMLRGDLLHTEAQAVSAWIFVELYHHAHPALMHAFAPFIERGSEMMMDVATGRPKVKHVEKYSYSSRSSVQE